MDNVLTKIFGSRLRAKLLGWFFSHMDEQYFVRQLAPILQEDATNISREMAKLEGLGILVSLRQGNLKQFRVNRDCSFLEELRGLVLKTAGVAGQLRTEVNRIPGVTLSFIYGSYAQGKETAQSDVDLLLVGHINQDTLDNALQELERGLGRTINYVLYDPAEFEEKRASGDGFITDVLAGPKLILTGEPGGFKVA